MNQRKDVAKLNTNEKPNVFRSLPSINWKAFKETINDIPVKKEASGGQKSMNRRHLVNSRNSKKIKEHLKDDKKKTARSECNSNGDVSTTQIAANDHDIDSSKKLTKVLAMDCEMVGVEDSKKNMLARVSIVNRFGNCVYDKYVKPTEPVVDYRTWVSGVRPHNLENGEDFEIVKQEVSDMLRGRIIIGHALRNDFTALTLRHPKGSIRDTSKFEAFRKLLSNSRTPALRTLARSVLGVCIQEGEHSSVQDAKTALQLYLAYKNEWEKKIASDKLKKRASNIRK